MNFLTSGSEDGATAEGVLVMTALNLPVSRAIRAKSHIMVSARLQSALQEISKYSRQSVKMCSAVHQLAEILVDAAPSFQIKSAVLVFARHPHPATT